MFTWKYSGGERIWCVQAKALIISWSDEYMDGGSDIYILWSVPKYVLTRKTTPHKVESLVYLTKNFVSPSPCLRAEKRSTIPFVSKMPPNCLHAPPQISLTPEVQRYSK